MRASLNPKSSFCLSLRVNYPNAFDVAWAENENRTSLGGDLRIHGSAASIGCLAIGDRAIEEIFCIVAKFGMDKTRVIIAPVDYRRDSGERGVCTLNVPEHLYDDIAEALEAYRPAPGPAIEHAPETL
ncbi:MAG: hypothetical protein AMXMBFR84_30740 [Candidatus Hydrogenedentota bacterium]